MKKIFLFLLLAICTIGARSQVISVCLEADFAMGAYVKVVSSSPTVGTTTIWIDLGGPTLCYYTNVSCRDQDGVNWDYLFAVPSYYFTGPGAPIPCYTVYYSDGSVLPPAAPSVTACLCPVAPRSSCFNIAKDGNYKVLFVFDPIALYLAGGYPANPGAGQVTILFSSTSGRFCNFSADPDGVDYDINVEVPSSYGTPDPCLTIYYTLTQLTDGIGDSYGDPLTWPTTFSTVVCPCCTASGYNFSVSESTNSGFDGSLPTPPYTQSFTSGTESSWTFGDGTTGVGTSVTHTYPGPGTYTVCANGNNADGTTCDSCFTFCLADPNITGANGGSNFCHSDFVATVVGSQVDLGMMISLMPPYYFKIDFGDGTVITNTSGVASHTYTASGTYTICVSEVGPQIAGPCTTCEDICVLVPPTNCCDPDHKASNNTTPTQTATEDMQLYPNPADNVAYLVLTLDNTSDIRVTIVDAVGRVVNKLAYDQVQKGTKKIELNTGNMNPGIYLVTVQTNKGTTTKQLSVIK